MKKIVIICHFTNEEIQSKLQLWKKSNEFAPWIPNFLKGLMKYDDLEIHVVSPHNYLKKDTNFTDNKITYHFLTSGVPIINLAWPSFFPINAYFNYFFFRKKVNRLVESLNPDLINLIGAENAYYSSSILEFKSKFPVLITIQGFIGQMKDSIKLTFYQKKRIQVEEEIYKNFKYFAGEMDGESYIKKLNPNSVYKKLYFPVNEEICLRKIKSNFNYDIIYYGRLVKLKGSEDFVKVVSLLKERNKYIKACIIGPGDIDALKVLASELGCFENIDFVGFVKNQDELFDFVQSSKVFLAPPYFERLSATIREAMYLKVPIVAYATGGIPIVNEKEEIIKLVKTGDYKGMADITFELLANEELRTNMANIAYEFAINEFSLMNNTNRLFDIYNTVINSKF